MTARAKSRELGLLLSSKMESDYGERIKSIGLACGQIVRLYVWPRQGSSELDDDALASLDVAFYSRDVWQGSTMAGQSEASVNFFQCVDAAPNLKWLHLTSSGVDLAQFPQYEPSIKRGMLLSTSSGSNALPIAQTVVAAVLSHGRGFLHWMGEQRECRWSQFSSQEQPRDLADQTVVIVGMGPIGREVGRLLKAVGMRTVGIRRTARPAQHFDAVHHYKDLDELLPQADFLVLACPLTVETRGLLDAERLCRMPRSATIVNVGRGELVDEVALTVALSSSRLRSAYLDVFSQEPLPAESPLWRLPNVWISPHNSSASAGNAGRVAEIFLNNLDRWMRGIPVSNAVKMSKNLALGMVCKTGPRLA